MFPTLTGEFLTTGPPGQSWARSWRAQYVLLPGDAGEHGTFWAVFKMVGTWGRGVWWWVERIGMEEVERDDTLLIICSHSGQITENYLWFDRGLGLAKKLKTSGNGHDRATDKLPVHSSSSNFYSQVSYVIKVLNPCTVLLTPSGQNATLCTLQKLPWRIVGLNKQGAIMGKFWGWIPVHHLPAMWLWANWVSVSLFVGFPDDSDGKESAWNAGDLGSIPASERSPGEGHGYPLQSSFLENSRRSLAGYSPWGRKELDTTEQHTLFLICEM